MGRSAAKVESAEESMRELAQQARAVLEHGKPGGLGDSARVLAPVALPLDPSRVSFTEIPEFDLGPSWTLKTVGDSSTPCLRGGT